MGCPAIVRRNSPSRRPPKCIIPRSSLPPGGMACDRRLCSLSGQSIPANESSVSTNSRHWSIQEQPHTRRGSIHKPSWLSGSANRRLSRHLRRHPRRRRRHPRLHPRLHPRRRPRHPCRECLWHRLQSNLLSHRPPPAADRLSGFLPPE